MARARVHQHVNPLAKYFRELPVEPLDLEEVFEDPEAPLFLDIGCARGRFILEMARVNGSNNFLGVEIREPLVDDANAIRNEEGLGNLHYEFCNATFDLEVLLSELPEGWLKTVAIQFPDPWFKKRHAKRRIVKESLVETLVRHLADDGQIILQTDVEFIADEMLEIFQNSGALEPEALDESPFEIKTEREIAVENKGLPVFRFRLRKT
ncbi:MAG: tRNA (guanosine(46)-N7)-methyltransferase TrmB [Acidobacteria bacterium]|nr:MAG: tRNA (guanosine(46)-N7)-methyltransferase TrmB [Acidobacteriota bacterium]REJ99298.1 MAG: tRNA (guanosine(46)-N7)-methyltransferase TrmB [Acidobacteriota bacterium]REK15982.1 MAG: tRNA (guanosine(46)-N7)-methyltransferase TrmB [Acidobacteriota bacterium]REK43663.1 MAG: tRNA (guanosine(46)-N7)-methyltransferase TrmB [Acidobacteriota bacterium]